MVAEIERTAQQRAELQKIQANAVAAIGQEIRCPRCGSSQIASGRKGFNGVAGLLGALAVGPIGLLAGCSGSGEIEITCLACSHRWKPSSLAYWVRKIAQARK
jgi:tellurium resistance protein TerD